MNRYSQGMAIVFALLLSDVPLATAQTPASPDSLMTIISVRPVADIEREIVRQGPWAIRRDLAREGFDRERKLAETRIGLKEKEIESLELKQDIAEQQKKTGEAERSEAEIKRAEALLNVLKVQLSVREAEVEAAEAQSRPRFSHEDGLGQEQESSGEASRGSQGARREPGPYVVSHCS